MEPWRKLGEETVYARYRRVVSKRFELPGGEQTEYEIKDEDDMVAVLALTDAGEFVLVRQFRPGPEAVLLELPARGRRSGLGAGRGRSVGAARGDGLRGPDRAGRDDARRRATPTGRSSCSSRAPAARKPSRRIRV